MLIPHCEATDGVFKHHISKESPTFKSSFLMIFQIAFYQQNLTSNLSIFESQERNFESVTTDAKMYFVSVTIDTRLGIIVSVTTDARITLFFLSHEIRM